MRNDLDAVLLKALAKDRDRRYDSVTAFAADLRRFLDDEPVSAAPPSRVYRLSKFVRRHRAAVGGAAVAAVAVAVGLVAALFGLVEARAAQGLAEAARVEAEAAREEMEVALRTAESTASFTIDLFRASSPRADPQAELSARDLLERGLERVSAMEGESRVKSRLLDSLSEISLVLGDYDQAERLIEQALAEQDALEAGPGSSVDPEDARHRAGLLHRLGNVYRERQDNRRAMEVYRGALDLLAVHHEDSLDTGLVLNDLAIVQTREEHMDEAIDGLNRAIELSERHEPQPSEAVASALTNLATVYHRTHRREEGVRTLHRALELSRQILPEDHPDFAIMLNNLAYMARSGGQFGKAAAYSIEGLALDRRVLGDLHPDVAHDLQGVGLAWMRLGRFEAAEAAFAEGIEIYRATKSSLYQECQLHFWRAINAIGEGRFERALGYLTEASEGFARVDARSARIRTVDAAVMRSDVLRQLGRPREALEVAARGLELGERIEYGRSRQRL
ncbi:MAG: tetratricopeptide repeat protein, partial [Acidobacteriota bacterium]